MFELFKFNKKEKESTHSREAFEDAEKEEKRAFKERIQDRHRPTHMRNPEKRIREHKEAEQRKKELLDAARTEAEEEDKQRGLEEAA